MLLCARQLSSYYAAPIQATCEAVFASVQPASYNWLIAMFLVSPDEF